MSDPQRAAYTDADETDWAHQATLLEGCVVHEPGDLTDVREPDEWHAEGWDANRQPPKTLDEAKAALAARVADPDAPDTVDHLHAYDDLEGE
jgi:hypothetical protein